MSIRLRFTLLYNAILALMLLVFGLGLYSIQAGTTFDALKQDLIRSSERIADPFGRAAVFLNPDSRLFPSESPRPVPFENFSGGQVFNELPEREIVRLLDADGNLIASPFGRTEDALPLSTEGLQSVQNKEEVWETGNYQDQRMLIYSRPVIVNDETAYILQVARPLTERDRSLQFLATTFTAASLVTILIAFGIGWVLSGLTLQPIQRLTQTARTIGDERDFTRRVAHTGPQDEVGQLATTFNEMLGHLQDAYQRVAYSLEMQRNFVADVSHELRTPLTTLRGNLGLLRREPPISAEEHTDILTDMEEESDRLIRLVNDLLVLARADAGRNLAHDTLDILPILEETCRQARQLETQRIVSLQTENLTVIGDRDAIKQVILIVLDNALKHSDGEVVVSAQKVGRQVEVRVRDHGEGIPPEKLIHVFDRFYRGEESASISGFGLGLAIAKALVEAIGGTISMESEVGKGSVLILGFPAPGS